MDNKIEEMKKKRTIYEKKLEEILKEFEKEIPPDFRIESAITVRPLGDKSQLQFHIKIELSEDLNK